MLEFKAIRNTYSLENNSIFEKQQKKKAATAFGEQSKAGFYVRNPVTSLSERAKAMPSSKKSLFAFTQLLSSPDLRTLSEPPTPKARLRLSWALRSSRTRRSRQGHSQRKRLLRAHASAGTRSSSVTARSRPPRAHQDCPAARARCLI